MSSVISNGLNLKQLKVFTVANLKSRYRNTFYGFAWVILNPILTYLVQVFAFTTLFQVRFPNYPVYLFAGLFPWIFILQSVEMCTGVFLYNFHIIKNYPINPSLLIWVQVLDNFINFFSAFLIVLIYFLATQKIGLTALAYCLLPAVFLFAAVVSMGTLFAILNIRYRDMKFIVSFVFSLLFYLTPIFYSIRMIGEKARMYLEFNPIYILIKPFQEALMGFPPEEIWKATLNSFLISTFLIVLSFVTWKKMKDYVVLYA